MRSSGGRNLAPPLSLVSLTKSTMAFLPGRHSTKEADPWAWVAERPTSVIANAAMLLRMVFILLISGPLSVKGLCLAGDFAGPPFWETARAFHGRSNGLVCITDNLHQFVNIHQHQNMRVYRTFPPGRFVAAESAWRNPAFGRQTQGLMLSLGGDVVVYQHEPVTSNTDAKARRAR
jgi:hypothetical protein